METYKNKEDSGQPKKVPENEVKEHFVRSGGKGGQNVNKLSTKAEIRWGVLASAAFTDEEKNKILEALKNRINKAGEVVITAQEERSQSRNRDRAREILNELVSRALVPEKERIPTQPTASSRRQRIDEKMHFSEKKKERSWRYE